MGSKSEPADSSRTENRRRNPNWFSIFELRRWLKVWRSTLQASWLAHKVNKADACGVPLIMRTIIVIMSTIVISCDCSYGEWRIEDGDWCNLTGRLYFCIYEIARYLGSSHSAYWLAWPTCSTCDLSGQLNNSSLATRWLDSSIAR